MIKPINGHVIIKPLEHKTFLPQEKGLYDEVGIIVDGVELLTEGGKVYFDKWLASEFPTGNGNEFFWLVNYKDIKAVDYGD